MKGIFGVLAINLLWLWASCDGSHIGDAEREQLVRRFVEEYYLHHAPPGQHYEFVSLTAIDTVYYQDNIAFRRQYIKADADRNRNMLRIAQQKQDSFLTVNVQKKIEQYEDRMNRYEQVLQGINELEAGLGKKANEVASYTYLFTLNTRDSLGAPQQLQYYVQTDPGLGVLSFTNDSATLYPNPNDFPGYREMAGRILKDSK
jgi:hypothetical protein